ncbi:alkylation response protein AidB-like acyl-CoA dehydrogenase [Leucobacter exalbidus]|uniref:Alkylation response protein AidB-like acyl-CoA dehydrogenase n=1 Tax=Leucobacter exalbidus TaxID=662960 RepID=A0A940T3P2_9MICO|nr:acyl-CoA dehydrogenase family protein [Leucobacter exalbidus]MBP1325979.1 alkylation response protein AidB-like acyl-CoA dehydrogenase [Leucobacter exalbidus]
MMELAWGEDFDALVDVSKSAFVRYSPLEERTNSVPFADQIAQFAELGWLQLSDPNVAADEGVPLTTIAAVFVEMGRALADTPLLDLIVARDAALAAGSEHAAALAERIGDGEAIVLPVFPDAAIAGSEWGGGLTIENGVLNGTAFAIGYADQAEAFLVHAVGAENVLAVVEAGAAVTVEPMSNMGDHEVFALSFANVAVPAESVLARGADADRAAKLASQRGSVLRAAQVYGAGLRLLDITVLYAQQRHQFGGPIGRFQAVQYLCTDIAVAAHLTSAHVRSAAGALDAGADAQPHLGLLHKQAIKTATHMVHCAHEVHAGIGYMVESNVHLFTNAAKRWQFDFGSAAHTDAEIVSALDRIYVGA